MCQNISTMDDGDFEGGEPFTGMLATSDPVEVAPDIASFSFFDPEGVWVGVTLCSLFLCVTSFAVS